MPDNSLSNKRIAKNTIFLYVRMIIVLLVSLYTTRVVLNVLGVVDYGIYNVVAGFVSMFAFLNSAMNNTTQRYYNYAKGIETIDSLNEVYNTSLLIQAILAIIIIVILESFGIWYINNKMVMPTEKIIEANWVFQFSVISLILLIMQIPYSAAIISHEKMDYYAIVSIIDAGLKLGIAIALPYIGTYKLIIYGALLLTISISNFILYYIYSKHQFKEITLRLRVNKKRFKEMLSFSGWNMFGSLAYTLQGQGLNVLMNAFFGPVVNAARGIAFQIEGSLNGFAANITTAFRPQLVESYAINNLQRTQNMMFKMSKYCYVMLYVLAVPIAIELQYILNLWLKGVIPEYTIIFTYLILINMLLGGLNMPISQTVQATGIVKYYHIIRSIIVASTLPVAWLFLTFGYSPTIVFWVTIAISIINQPVSMIILHRNFSYSYKSYFNKVIIPCLLLTILLPIVPIIIHFFMADSLLKLGTVILSSLLISIILSYYVVLDKTERFVLLSAVKAFFKKHHL